MAISSIKLSELNNQIKQVIENSFMEPVWVVAEISEIRINNNGHCYLELIEKDTLSDQITARSRANIWAYTFRMLKPYFETTTGQPLTSGIKILIQVSVEFQEVFGFSLNIKNIDPSYTLGDIARKRREILLRLEDEGVLEMNKELDIPLVIQRIAIISSSTAAGYEDFINQLENNDLELNFYHKLFPAIMQGDNAEASIIRPHDKIYNHEDFFDVVVIIRGGGAAADLMCFDSYHLAVNIAQFPIPVLTGIGHERDETVADKVANLKLKTPTAVAEFIIGLAEDFNDKIEDAEEQLRTSINEILESSHQRLNIAIKQIVPIVKGNLAKQKNILQHQSANLSFLTKNTLRNGNISLSSMGDRLKRTSFQNTLIKKSQLVFHQRSLKSVSSLLLRTHKQTLRMLEESNRLHDPQNILRRGFSLTYLNGKLIRQIEQTNPGDLITTQLFNGKIISRIEEEHSS